MKVQITQRELQKIQILLGIRGKKFWMISKVPYNSADKKKT